MIQIKIVRQEYESIHNQLPDNQAAYIKRDVMIWAPGFPVITIRTGTRAYAAFIAWDWAESIK